jgi:signal peptidase I
VHRKAPRTAGRLRPSRRTSSRTLVLVAVGLALAAVLGGGAALWLQGSYHAYVVHTGSMAPTYRSGDLVIDRSPSSYRAGDVITFRHSDRTTDVVTHRVVSVSAAGITTKGDANATPDAWTIRPSQVQGRTVLGVPYLGYVAVYFKQPAGVASAATTMACVMLLWSLFFGSREAVSQVPDPVRETTYVTIDALILSPRT